MTLTAPRTGPCSPWIDASDVIASVASVTTTTLSDQDARDIALTISELLYRFSGNQFTGACGPETVRPAQRR